MRRHRPIVVAAALLAILVVGGCASSAQPSSSAQATSGPGWRLIQIRGGNIGPAVEVHPLGWDAYLIELTVQGAGSQDCSRPRFLGFEPRADVLVARFERPPVTGTCLVTSTAVFDVLLERRFIPVGVSRLELSESCGDEQPGPGCPRNGIPIVGPGGTPLPEPSESMPTAGQAGEAG